MKRALFEELFERKVREALVAVPGTPDRAPRTCMFEFHGGGHDGTLMSLAAAAAAAYVSEELFYVFIDVGVRRFTPSSTTIFVGISGHPPVPFDRTYNTPPGSGPFKVVTPV
jgi:hypothetical protein